MKPFTSDASPDCGFGRSRFSLPGKLILLMGSVIGTYAQLPPDALRQLNNNLANDAVSAIEVFSAADTIATGVFQYNNPGPDDVDFSTYKLPLTHEFGGRTNSFRPMVAGYLGYFDLRQGVTGFGPPPGTISIRSLTAAGGGGATWQATDWLAVTPRLLAAYSHTWDRFDRAAPPGDPFANALPNWEADSLTLLPSLECNLSRKWRRWDLTLTSRYTFMRVLSLHDTSPLQELSSTSQVWRNAILIGWDTPWAPFELPLHASATFARHDLSGQIRHADFVNYFYEARVNFEFRLPKQFRYLRTAGLSGGYYFEGPFSGYSVGLTTEF